MCIPLISFFITSCTSKKDRKTEKFIESVLITKIHEYPYNEYDKYVYDGLKSSTVNDSISYYILNYHSTDMYGHKKSSFTYGYFNMNTGYDVTELEDSIDLNSFNRFMNAEIY